MSGGTPPLVRFARLFVRSQLSYTTVQVVDPTAVELGIEPSGDVVVEVRVRVRRDDLEGLRRVITEGAR
jgi:hypothetical protein